jgi:glycosyltransferase involved in cell wall biosynthesis
MPIVEAMACGVPVVASAHPSMDEACGEAAVRVDPTDADEIAAGIRDAFERRAELAAAGVEHAARFTWRRCGEIHLRAFQEVAR